MKARPPPTSPPPISSEEINVIKKRIAPPKGPPPEGLLGFKPKKYDDEQSSRRYHNEDEEDEDGQHEYKHNDNDNDEEEYQYQKQRQNYRRKSHADEEEYDEDGDQDYKRGGSGSGGVNSSRSSDHNSHGNSHSHNYNHSRNRSHSSQRRGSGGGRGGGGYDDEDDIDDIPMLPDEGSSYDQDHTHGGSRHHHQHHHQHHGYSRDLNNEYDDDEETDVYPQRPSQETKYDELDKNMKREMENKTSTSTTPDLLERKSGPVDMLGGMMPSSPERERIYNFRKVLRATMKELRNFVVTPCEPGVIVRCYIERNRSGRNMFSPVYCLCADLEDGTGREIITCRKIVKSKTSHYVFSMKHDDLYRKREQRSRLYLGKLRSLSNNEYVMYDNGVCDGKEGEDDDIDMTHDDASDSSDDDFNGNNGNSNGKKERTSESKGFGDEERSLFRQPLAGIYFGTKARPCPSDIRGMEIALPACSPPPPSNLVDTVIIPKHSFNVKNIQPCGNLVRKFSKIRETGRQNDLYVNKVFVLHEKQSRYDPLSSCLVDFQGRASVASIKNFQLIKSVAQRPKPGSTPKQKVADGEIILQMGKNSPNCFNMDYKFPLNMLQAFAICIARFDAKLTWE